MSFWKRIGVWALGIVVVASGIVYMGKTLYAWHEQLEFQREVATYQREVMSDLAHRALHKARPFMTDVRYAVLSDRVSRAEVSGAYGGESYATVVWDISNEIGWWCRETLEERGYPQHTAGSDEWNAARAELEKEFPDFVEVHDLMIVSQRLRECSYQYDEEDYQKDRISFPKCKERIDTLLASKD